MTVETAGLLAQIFPVFLLAILVESRFIGAGLAQIKFKTNQISKGAQYTAVISRMFGVLSTLYASFFCVAAVIQDKVLDGLVFAIWTGFVGGLIAAVMMVVDLLIQQIRAVH